MISLTSPVRTRFHDWAAGGKLATLCVVTAGLFHLDDPIPLGVALAGVVCLYASGGPEFVRAGARALRLLWPFVAVVGLWHLWMGEPAAGSVIVMRMVSAVALANFVTMTTRLSEMTEVAGWLFSSLRRFGLSVRGLELAIAIVIRMTPLFVEKTDALTRAWRARSARRPDWRLLFPLALAVMDDADHVAEALRARGGLNSGNNDPWNEPLH